MGNIIFLVNVTLGVTPRIFIITMSHYISVLCSHLLWVILNDNEKKDASVFWCFMWSFRREMPWGTLKYTPTLFFIIDLSTEDSNISLKKSSLRWLVLLWEGHDVGSNVFPCTCTCVTTKHYDWNCVQWCSLLSMLDPPHKILSPLVLCSNWNTETL